MPFEIKIDKDIASIFFLEHLLGWTTSDLDIKLNSAITIHDEKYLINNMDINLKTGRTKLILLRDV